MQVPLKLLKSIIASAGIAMWLILPAVAAGAEAPATELSLNLHDQGSPFRGWGTSLAWWAHGVGDWPEKTVDEVVHQITDPQKGLGLNVFRYNIGGGDQPDHHHLRRWGDVPGFKAALGAPYDWEADAAQRRVLLKLVKAAGGASIVEGFSNSAPWWMTVSGCVAGAADGGPNLKPSFEGAFADYLADVAQFYKDRQGVTFDTLEPFNEPDARWWKAGGGQEGMFVPHEQQARLIRLLRAALDRRGMQKMLVSATDANTVADALSSLLSFDAPTLAALGQVNTHGYSDGKRVELRQAAAERGKRLSLSESGPLAVTGSEYDQIMVVAGRIVLDLNQLRAQTWCTWQVVSGGAWGCLHTSFRSKTFRTGKMFDALAAFTRHIRPGDRLVNLDSDSVVAAVSTARHEVTLVLVNRGKDPHRFRLTIQGAARLPAATAAGVCCTETTDGLTPFPPAKFHGTVLELTTAPESVTCVTFPCSPT